MGWPGSWMVWYGGPIPPVLPSALDLLMEGGSVQWPPQVVMGVKPFPTQGT